MQSDQRQPGSSDMRDALVPPIRTTSILVLSGVRVSSGAEKSRTSNPAIEPSSLVACPHADPKPVPLGQFSTPSEAKTGTDGWATDTMSQAAHYRHRRG